MQSFSTVLFAWGANTNTSRYYPKRDWIQNFSQTSDVVAYGSISKAIKSCDSVVGENEYCVVEIKDTAWGFPLEILRNKIKLIGSKSMQALAMKDNDTFIYIGDNIHNIVIEGLNLRGHNAGVEEIYGIMIEGRNINNILIRNNKIHHLMSNTDAHGIAVYGTGNTSNYQHITNVIIEDNEVYNMRTGSSENIVINGNVSKWQIKNNYIHDINNIAIDVIGGEGTSKTPGRPHGRLLPYYFDAARYGVIENNLVKNMTTLNNPAYDNEAIWAGAIYVDGGHHIMIKNNMVINTPWAYDIGAENCVNTRHILLVKNTARRSHFGDLSIGAYRKRGYLDYPKINCEPETSIDEQEGHGYVKNITVKNNKFKSTNTLEDNILLLFRTTNSIIIAPGVKAQNTQNNGAANGDNNAIRTW